MQAFYEGLSSYRLNYTELPFGHDLLSVCVNWVGMKKREYYKNIWVDFNKEKEMVSTFHRVGLCALMQKFFNLETIK